MGKKSKATEFTYEVEDIVGIIRETDRHDWIKAVLKIAWSNDMNTLDIRSINLKNKKLGKGISLSNEDADRLVNILLENNFGSLEDLEKAIKRKRSFFTVEEKPIDIGECDEDYMYNIDIKVED